ncbi:MAG: response regulator transcription factor [Bacteroidetes bacterium]|nr:response regulator transcription factor [Bacteroidota bacterium]
MDILIVEDELKVASFIKQGLVENGYHVEVVYDGLLAKSLIMRNRYNLILVDIIIPGINGIELTRLIKEKKPNIPVLMLTALGTLDDKIQGFDAGADDYLVKPFEFKELLARIRVLTRREAGKVESSNKIKVFDLELDLDKKIFRRQEKEIELTAKEFHLLEYFMRNSGRVLSRSELAEKVWELTFDTGTNIVDVYINILRRKIDKDFATKLIHTRFGLGYIFDQE